MEKVADGDKAKVIDQSSPVGRDWWETQFEPATKTWAVTYTNNLDTLNDERKSQAFRWRVWE